MPPNCSRWKFSSVVPSDRSLVSPSRRWKWNTEPWRSLVPDFVMTLTTPPAVRPNSAGAPLAITWNSFTASSVMSIGARWPPACSPKKPLLKSPPSRLMLLKTPRWPANVISSPSGPCTMLTPGVSVSRSSNLRPRIGVVSIVVSLSVVATAARVVSTTGVPLTVTVSVTLPTARRGVRLTAWPTVRSMFSCTNGAEARQPEGRRVAARRQLQEHEASVRVRRPALREIRLWIDDRDVDARQHGARRIHHRALNDAGRDLGLCGESGGQRETANQQWKSTRGIGASVGKRNAAKTAEQCKTGVERRCQVTRIS